MSFNDVLALENPTSALTDNLVGTNVFANAGLTVFDDFSVGSVQVEAPEPPTLLLLLAAVGLISVGRRFRSNRSMSAS